MVDFKKKLAESRAKEALDKQLKKVKKDSAPNMNPGYTDKYAREKEPPPPELAEFELPADQEKQLRTLVDRHSTLTVTVSILNREKKSLVERIKPICKAYELSKFMAEGVRANYYKTDKHTISRELLLQHGVAPEIITACTTETTSWSFRTSRGNNGDEEEEQD